MVEDVSWTESNKPVTGSVVLVLAGHFVQWERRQIVLFIGTSNKHTLESFQTLKDVLVVKYSHTGEGGKMLLLLPYDLDGGRRHFMRGYSIRRLENEGFNVS